MRNCAKGIDLHQWAAQAGRTGMHKARPLAVPFAYDPGCACGLTGLTSNVQSLRSLVLAILVAGCHPPKEYMDDLALLAAS